MLLILFLGLALEGTERYDDAIAAYQHAQSINPGSLEALGFLGGTKATVGDGKGALSLVKQLVAADGTAEPAILVAYI